MFVLMFACCIEAAAQKTADTENIQTGYCPQTHQLEAEPSQKFFFEGMIGGRRVRMYLDRGGSGIVGLFFDIDGNCDTTLLGGTWNNGLIDVSDAAENHSATERLKASISGNRLMGTWTATGSDHPEPVELVSISEPRCDGKEEWKRFDDPTWPVSFSYPASWHVEQSGKSVTLTCPDPANLAYDDQITIYAGTGDPDGPPDEPTELLRCGDTWRYGGPPSCDCKKPDSLSCGTAKVFHKDSPTILDVSNREWRVYCRDGGYVSQGEGEDRILLLKGTWLEVVGEGRSSEIVERLTTTVRVREPNKIK
jgi:hypothetical protein